MWTKTVVSHFWSFNTRSISPLTTPISEFKLITVHASAPPNHYDMTQRVLTCKCKKKSSLISSKPTILLMPKSVEDFLQTRVGLENFSKSRLVKDHITSINYIHPTILLFQKRHDELIALLPSAFFLNFYGKPVLLSSAGQGAHSLELVNLPGLEIQELQDAKLISSITMYLCVSKAHFPFPLLKEMSTANTEF